MSVNTRTTCRVSNDKLDQLWDLGNLYLSHFYDEKKTSAHSAPLRVGIGQKSKLLQLMDTVDRDLMYKKYWYLSGTNETMTNQLKDIVNIVPNWARLKDDDIVLDIGCNDGTLLKQYSSNINIKKYGIDPAKNISEIAMQNMDVYNCDYFSKDIFLKMSNGEKAKAITSIAMFYDLENPDEFTKDIKACLDPNGIWILQLSYTPLMLLQNAFDNIIHEHLEYYTLKSIDYLMNKNDLKI